ncbi:MAG: hypothetical protein U0T07_09665 [Chitinophagales bacterium]
MNETGQRIISIGWDVGGWYGDKNACTVMEYYKGSIQQQPPILFDFRGNDSVYDLDSITNKILAPVKDYLESHDKNVKIIVAIDAPLSFSKNFKLLVDRKIDVSNFSNVKKNNSIAFRTTEILINNKFKNCLSPVFDSIGNPTTLGQMVMLKLKSIGFKYIPVDSINYDSIESSNRIVIEVYPGILRNSKYYSNTGIIDSSGHFSSDGYEPCKRYYSDLGSGSKPKSTEMDEYDSMLCSMLGISFAKSFYGDENNEIPLPEIETNIDSKFVGDAAQEGWIFYPRV